MRKPVVTFITDEETDKDLRKAAAEKRITRAELMRQIVAEWRKKWVKEDDHQ